MAEKKKRWCHFRHKIWFGMMQPIFSILLYNKYRYKAEKFKLEKKQNYFIICNHACSLDPFMVSKSFNRPVYYIASDDLMKNRFASFWMRHAVAPIPIRKGVVDLGCIKNCINIAKEGGTIGIFPEGNRTYTGEVFHIEKSIIKLIRKLNIPLIIYHIDGGYGVDPRWGKSARKGKGTKGRVEVLLSVDEIKSMTDDELFDLIMKTFSKAPSPSLRFKSKSRAEYLERILFICPKCHKLETLYSKGNKLICSSCSFEATYEEDLSFTINDPSIEIKDVKSFCKFEKDYLKDYEVKENEILLSDNNVEVISTKGQLQKAVIAKGKLEMYSDHFVIKGEKELIFNFSDISQLVNQGKHKVLFYIGNDYYQFKGEDRFSSYKYYLMYHKIHDSLDNTL